jgi:hypothetical protein
MPSARRTRRHQLELEMLPQPDDTTCGPTCLHAVYRYLGYEVPLDELIHKVPRLKTGGTLGVMLGRDALRRGFRVTMYTYNLLVFDPTWFSGEPVDLAEKLAAQARAKRSAKLKLVSRAYIDFLRMGGEIRFENLRGGLIRRHLNEGRPIITGLSSTYLYQAMREYGPEDVEDDIRGQPAGHFVVLCGYDRKAREVLVADPLETNPHSPTRRYSIDINRVLSSILLGVLTYDANLLIIDKAPAGEPGSSRAQSHRRQ